MKLSEGIHLPSRSLGVFGVPMGPGEFAASEALGGGHIEGVDVSTTALFDSNSAEDTFERTYTEYMDHESELKNQQGLYDALQHDVQQLDQAVGRMCEIRDMHLRYGYTKALRSQYNRSTNLIS